MSPSFARLWGRPLEELKHNPRTWLDCVQAEDREAHGSGLRRDDGGRPYGCRVPAGAGRWRGARSPRARAFPVSNTAGVFYRVAGICQDITPQSAPSACCWEEDHRKDSFPGHAGPTNGGNPLPAPMRSAADDADAVRAHARGEHLQGPRHHRPPAASPDPAGRRPARYLASHPGLAMLRNDIVELRTALSTAVEAVRPLIDTRGHSLRLSVPEGPMPVRGDLVRLTQIFSNLLHNAARHTQPDGQLALEVTCDGSLLTVKVRDNGPGLSPQALLAIFDPATAHHGDSVLRRRTGRHGYRALAGAKACQAAWRQCPCRERRPWPWLRLRGGTARPALAELAARSRQAQVPAGHAAHGDGGGRQHRARWRPWPLRSKPWGTRW
ncbi:PAS domain-containing sensor histidine kinase [Cupriavidus basilensis]